MLVECCMLLEHHHCEARARVGAPSEDEIAEALQRAERRVREAFAEVGEDFEAPTVLAVFEAAEVLAGHEAYKHPLFAAHLERLATHCAQAEA